MIEVDEVDTTSSETGLPSGAIKRGMEACL